LSPTPSLHTDILVIGAGPGGLACAKLLAEHGREVIVLERKHTDTIGAKVCAGGITWDGLIRLVPEDLIERSFCEQYVFSNYQKVVVREKNPIIATINRKTLGNWMAQQAIQAGAELVTGSRVCAINDKTVTVATSSGETKTYTCSHLVGADGATSIVRRSMGIPVRQIGPGINYQIAGSVNKMEWHLNSRAFGYGYGWIFPHKETVSIGAYGPAGNMSGGRLKKNLIKWASAKGYNLQGEQCRAALINYDYRGYSFGSIWLVGDAAGLASGLTGEGIYPAIVSGETVGRKILDPDSTDDAITAMVKKQQQHRKVINLSAKNPALCSLLMEMLVLMLRVKFINFHTLEMAVTER
jgi:geranylgeranyl reductase